MAGTMTTGRNQLETVAGLGVSASTLDHQENVFTNAGSHSLVSFF
jgi:hypothetical protein